MSFLGEIKRRSVAKVGIAYAVTGWIVVDISSVLFPIFGAPAWVLRVLTTLVILGFPVALTVSWIYELTPEGLRRTDDLPEELTIPAGRRRLDYVIVGLLVCALGTFMLDRWVLRSHQAVAPTAAAVDKQEPADKGEPMVNGRAAVAVLPFLNLSSDPEQDFFADGLTEELLNRLAKIPSLRVAARTSSFHFKGKNPELREVGDALHVGMVVEGSVRKSSDRVRITAQLIDVASGYDLWSETYDRQLTDIFSIEDNIVAEIMRALSIHIGDVESTSSDLQPVDAEVYQLVLRGRFHWNQRTPDGLAESVALFHEATQRAPDYAPAYAGLADAYLTQYDYGMISWEDSTVKARAAASKALELDDRLAEAHVSLAHILMHEWAWQKAETEFQRAMELNPSYVVAHHWFALCLTALGRVDEAVAAMQRAQELDPVSVRINADLGMAYLAAGQYDQAVDQEGLTLDLDPNASAARWIRGMAFEQMGQFDQAEADMRAVFTEWGPDPVILGSLGHLYAVQGKKDEASKLLGELLAQQGKAEIAFFVALIHAGSNEPDQTLQWLQRAVDERSGSVRYLKVEPRLASVRTAPGYQALLDRVGLPR